MYTLELTEADVSAIHLIGGRYAWSTALLPFEAGKLVLVESEAWTLSEAFHADTEGGHHPFPMLNRNSELYAKLISFWDSIV